MCHIIPSGPITWNDTNKSIDLSKHTAASDSSSSPLVGGSLLLIHIIRHLVGIEGLTICVKS